MKLTSGGGERGSGESGGEGNSIEHYALRIENRGSTLIRNPHFL